MGRSVSKEVKKGTRNNISKLLIMHQMDMECNTAVANSSSGNASYLRGACGVNKESVHEGQVGETG